MSSGHDFPSQCELKCTGFSIVITQILLGIAWLMHAIDYDAYDVTNEEQVIKLHNILSSSDHRTEIEIACACVWVSFPLLLVSLFGISKLGISIFYQTPAEMVVYVLEKSYIIYIAAITIMLPALSLVSVSYEWSFHEHTPSPDIVQTGYYIQLYALTLELELIDCIAIADATFMISLFLLPRFILLGSSPAGNPRFKQFRSIMEPKCCRNKDVMFKCFCEIFTVCMVTSLVIVFCIILFEFAESGFFSPVGYAKFLVGWSFVLKFLIGVRFINIAYSQKYIKLKEVFGEQQNVNAILTPAQENNYQMDTINLKDQISTEELQRTNDNDADT
eukprot:321186_1